MKPHSHNKYMRSGFRSFVGFVFCAHFIFKTLTIFGVEKERIPHFFFGRCRCTATSDLWWPAVVNQL